MKQSGWRRAVKRTVDFTAAAAGIVALAPVMGVVAVAVRASLGAPVLFRQTRPGRDAKPFDLIKFRTMRDAVDARGTPLPDAERMTPIGQLLRATSLDELPQLFNVLRGDLSLVGPRPLLFEYLERYSVQEARRHEVMPGITGLAAVSGRNALDWNERLRLDVEYVDTWSLTLDARILAQTVVTVLSRRGVSAEGHVTSPVLQHHTSRSASGGDAALQRQRVS